MGARIYKSHNNTGFTIIEVLIVMAIASLILVIVFIAVPTLQRNQRNQRRRNDAAHLVLLVRECFENNHYRASACATPDQIGFQPEMFTAYTGVHYGSTSLSAGGTQIPPTKDEPNWLFHLRCSDSLNQVISDGATPRHFVVGYWLESGNWLGFTGHCFDGGL